MTFQDLTDDQKAKLIKARGLICEARGLIEEIEQECEGLFGIEDISSDVQNAEGALDEMTGL